MNIKEAERLSGVSRQNIRFYEKKGLLKPDRNRENDYREYSDEDIQTLKLIRMLRMLDMPIEQIREVTEGKITLVKAADAHRQELVTRKMQLEAVIEFCDELCAEHGADIDALLLRMDSAESKNFFHSWLKDYIQSVKQTLWLLLIGMLPSVVGLGAFQPLAICAMIPVLGQVVSVGLLIGWGYVGYQVTDHWGRLVKNTVLTHVFIAVGLAVCQLYNLAPGIREQIEGLESLAYGLFFTPMIFLLCSLVGVSDSGWARTLLVVSYDHIYIVWLLLLVVSFWLGGMIALLREWNAKRRAVELGSEA